jgi:hypothetical protein
MTHTLLDAFNLEALRCRSVAKPRAEFLKWLGQYGHKLQAMNISREDCCIVGSSSLEIMGIRQSTGVDFTVRKKVRETLFTKSFQEIGAQLDVVSEGYHQVITGERYSDDLLIDDSRLHIRFRGFKFASLNVVRDRKNFHGRPKDVLDVELIDNYLAKLKLGRT